MTASGRAQRLTRLIRAFLAGKLSPKELEKQLETLYNRHGEARTTLPRHSGLDPESSPSLASSERSEHGRQESHQPTTPTRHSGPDQESRNNHRPAPNPRHSGLDPESTQLVTGHDPLYRQIYQTITSTHPLRTGLRQDQIESYANTVSARAATAERLAEYQNRGVKKVQIVAYIDSATTDICRSMHGRIFEVPSATPPRHSGLDPESNLSLASSERSEHGRQEPPPTHTPPRHSGPDPESTQLVLPASFWADNHHFSQTPTSQMRPFLPPYHYNCRTRVIPYIEPANDYDAALDSYHNLEPLQEKHLQAIMEKARGLKFASQSLLDNHLKKHGHEFGVTSARQYLNLTKEMINSPLTNAALAISARDGSLNLYLWSPRQWQLNGEPVHNFAVFSLDNKCLKTFYPKSLEKIMANLDPEVHFKVVSLTNNLIRKGIKMVTEYDVKCYEDIIDYLEWRDGTDELEIVSRLEFEKEWDSITTELKLRIMKVDKIVLDRYADWHDDYLFKRYIDTIKARLERHSGLDPESTQPTTPTRHSGLDPESTS